MLQLICLFLYNKFILEWININCTKLNLKFFAKDYTVNIGSIIYKRHICILIIEVGKKEIFLHRLK